MAPVPQPVASLQAGILFHCFAEDMENDKVCFLDVSPVLTLHDEGDLNAGGSRPSTTAQHAHGVYARAGGNLKHLQEIRA